MTLELLLLDEDCSFQFKQDMQLAFKQGAEHLMGDSGAEVLPKSDIDRSLDKKGSVGLKALLDGEMIGGAIVVIEDDRASLDFLYVKSALQGQVIGQKIFSMIEKRFPKVKVWETYTPYFEKRNLHFYINCLGFCAVEFFNPKHPDISAPANGDNQDELFFRLQKTVL